MRHRYDNSFSPGFSVWKRIVIKRLRFHLNAVTRIQRRQVATVFHRHRINKMFVQMIDIFRDAILILIYLR